MDKTKKRKIFSVIGKIIIILVFAIITITTAKAHEPWSDEAQSFLIAKDSSFKEIFTQAKYEGTTPLWFLIIKFFLLIGGSYETFFILPIFFSILGVIILEFKVKAPWYIKLLLPFTYFILFQYSVVARSYCMLFPALMWIASVYRDRGEHLISYCLALLFLMSICSFSMVIASSLFLIDIIKIWKEKVCTKRNIIFCVIIALGLLGTFLIILPAKDCSFTPGSSSSIFHVVYQATVGSQKDSLLASILVTLVVLCTIIAAIFKEKDRKWKAINLLILFIPVSAEVLLIAPQIWHIGNIALLILTAFIINGMIINNRIIQIFILVVCTFQIGWSAVSVCYELNNNYSGSKDSAEFIKQNHYEDRIIYGLGFDITALQPYFDRNIFKNQNTAKRYWLWKKDNGYIQDDTLVDLDDDAIFVISGINLESFRNIYDKLKEKGYQEYYFSGQMFAKTYICEPKDYYILTK